MKAAKVNAGLAESNGKLLPGLWRELLHVTCGLTACTPGSAPGATLGNEYGKTLPFYSVYLLTYLKTTCRNFTKFLYMLRVIVAQSFDNDNAIRYTCIRA